VRISERGQGFTESVIREMTRVVSQDVCQARRDPLYGHVERAGFVTWKRRGAYYILTDAGHFIERLGLENDTAFAMWLIKDVGVATVPGSSFYAHPELGRTKIRFCFPKTDDVLIDAGERLQKPRQLAG
jgi:aminotransferase